MMTFRSSNRDGRLEDARDSARGRARARRARARTRGVRGGEEAPSDRACVRAEVAAVDVTRRLKAEPSDESRQPRDSARPTIPLNEGRPRLRSHTILTRPKTYYTEKLLITASAGGLAPRASLTRRRAPRRPRLPRASPLVVSSVIARAGERDADARMLASSVPASTRPSARASSSSSSSSSRRGGGGGGRAMSRVRRASSEDDDAATTTTTTTTPEDPPAPSTSSYGAAMQNVNAAGVSLFASMALGAKRDLAMPHLEVPDV
eukprot:31264-Pelagococcus_subviridis.AAC.1